jgi:hypothetical protein
LWANWLISTRSVHFVARDVAQDSGGDYAGAGTQLAKGVACAQGFGQLSHEFSLFSHFTQRTIGVAKVQLKGHTVKRATSVTVVLALVVATLAEAQNPQSPIPPQPKSTPTQVTKPAPTRPTLEDGTPIKLRLGETLSSANAHAGQTVEFEVLEEVKVADVTVVPKGAVAWATVTEAEHKKSMGRGGKLNVNIDSVRLVDGEKAALRAEQNAKGGGHVGAMTGAIVATSIVFFPAAPLFLFIHGKDITIPKGTAVTAFVNGDVPLDLAKFQSPGTTPSIAAASTAANATLDISSTPPGAEIELDGSFSGDTPSAITVAPGEHTIRISKAGYKSWERKMKTTSGNIKIVADLEQSQSDTTQRVAPEVPNTPKPAPAIAPTQPAPVAPTQPAAGPPAQQATVEFWSEDDQSDIRKSQSCCLHAASGRHFSLGRLGGALLISGRAS